MEGCGIGELGHRGHGAGGRPHVVVGRLGGALAARQELLAVRVEKRDHGLVVLVVAAEQPLGFLGGQVEAVEEGLVALGRRSRAGQEDVVAILQDGRAAVGHGFFHGAAGVVVAVLVIARPDELGRPAPGLSRSIWKVRDQRFRRSKSSTSAMPPFSAIWIPWKRCSVLNSLARLAGEWRLQRQDVVADRAPCFSDRRHPAPPPR